jgi:hypothetical protein
MIHRRFLVEVSPGREIRMNLPAPRLCYRQISECFSTINQENSELLGAVSTSRPPKSGVGCRSANLSQRSHAYFDQRDRSLSLAGLKSINDSVVEVLCYE